MRRAWQNQGKNAGAQKRRAKRRPESYHQECRISLDIRFKRMGEGGRGARMMGRVWGGWREDWSRSAIMQKDLAKKIEQGTQRNDRGGR